MSGPRRGSSVKRDLVIGESYEGRRTRCAYPECKRTIKHGQMHTVVYQVITVDVSFKGLRANARYCGTACRTANLNRIADLRAGIVEED